MQESKQIIVKIQKGIELTEYEKNIVITQLRKIPNKKNPKINKVNIALNSQAMKLSSRLKKSATSQEKKVKVLLDESNIEYVFQKSFVIRGKIFISDFYLPDVKTTIEIDGFHHFHNPQKAKDIIKTKALKSTGVKTMRFTNKEVDEDIHLVIWTIKNLVIYKD